MSTGSGPGQIRRYKPQSHDDDSEVHYTNDPRRTSVRREQLADSIERELQESSALKPISTKDYQNKIRRLQTLASVVESPVVPVNEQVDAGREQRQQRPLARAQSSFLNRVITYFGEHKAALESDPKEIARTVETFVQKVMKAVAYKDPRFKGQLVPCGSYYEGVKVKHPNEFDYLWELTEAGLPAQSLEFRNIKPDTFKPRKNPNVYGRSYYKVSFRDHVPKAWVCVHCRSKNKGKGTSSSGNRTIECPHTEIEARTVQDQFRNTVMAVASHLSNDWSTAQVVSSGPAVTLFTELGVSGNEHMLTRAGRSKLKRNDTINSFLIKIDITLAIPVEKSNPNLSWPLEGHGEVEINHDLIGREFDINKCHLVAAGDFWRASFSSWETQFVHEMTANNINKRNCFQALKYIRDMLSLTGELETSLLGTYPLKVTFLKENKEGQDTDDWHDTAVSVKTANILERVEKGGSEGQLTSLFIKNDPVLLESDRSYLESRRIKLYLGKLARYYRINGYVHIVILSIFYAMQSGLCLVIGLETRNFRPVSEECRIDGRTEETLEVGQYFFKLLPLTLVAMIMALCGLFFILVQTCCIQTTNVIYKMYFGPLIHYSILAPISCIQFCLAVRLLAGFSNLIDNCVNTSPQIARFSYVIFGFSALIVLCAMVHLAIFLVVAGRRLIYYGWEIIFFDPVYKTLCNCKASSGTTVNSQVNLSFDMQNDVDEQPYEDVEAVTSPRLPGQTHSMPLDSNNLDIALDEDETHQPQLTWGEQINQRTDMTQGLEITQRPDLPRKPEVTPRRQVTHTSEVTQRPDISQKPLTTKQLDVTRRPLPPKPRPEAPLVDEQRHQMTDTSSQPPSFNSQPDSVPPPVPPRRSSSSPNHEFENQLYSLS